MKFYTKEKIISLVPPSKSICNTSGIWSYKDHQIFGRCLIFKIPDCMIQYGIESITLTANITFWLSLKTRNEFILRFSDRSAWALVEKSKDVDLR